MFRKIMIIASIITGFIIAFAAGFFTGRAYEQGEDRRGGGVYHSAPASTEEKEKKPDRGPKDMGEFSEGIKRAFEGK